MSDGRFRVPEPVNEPVRDYAPSSPERASLEQRLRTMSGERVEAPNVIDGRDVTTGDTFVARAPHRHDLELADVHAAGRDEVQQAIEAALAAKHDWSRTPFEHRCAIFLRAAELLAGPWRDTLNAATVLHQSKSVLQAEIDAACELIDFLRFNVAFAQRVYDEQPQSVAGEWNRTDHRPLEGFVLAVTPFNFTAIAGNLPTAPALMGNTVVWKPSEKQALSAHHLMRLLQAAGLPDGVINLVHGDGAQAVDVATASPHLGGLHFTGSAAVLSGLFRKVGENIDRFRAFPRIVGESGGKDFVVAHPSADVDRLVVALGRGAFEYQGQKCSAASRAYVPRSVWQHVRDPLADLASSLTMGDVGEDLSTFMGAVIDGRAWARHRDAIDQAAHAGAEVLVGGDPDDADGWFVPPTVLVTDDPRASTMTEELFGPILTVHVYDDADFDTVLGEVDQAAPYALTGSIFADDRRAVARATDALRDTAGNFYVNDKPTGSIVGRQPFGGARRSGTNDKAGSVLNLQRWVSPRVIKETWVSPVDPRYPHMG
ncbi:L-glutamate gamma-semialdehyde dehydrogenase [Egicoccus halophilus]|uniref:L-glutamate gamma-semialdehyde dehydrogenase n=1 Tax=Egicoccus halophilus TaxID=1670830 RepID=A0A8J3EZD8_9ACTN|nr:L-glutamate gamma-semialdehyde dehydrogenase [Egicoccus halophilus]GGI09769.1 1-pyrroline-5-carboxylate dehydrogenase [Egicoccus halophilus]